MDFAALKVKKREAQARFANVPGVEGFGIGEGTIRVYLTRADVKHQLPTQINGVPLEFVITGDIVAR